MIEWKIMRMPTKLHLHGKDEEENKGNLRKI